MTRKDTGATTAGYRAVMLRHRLVPHREFGATVVAARPRDGVAVVMTSTAVVVWHLLDDWTTEADLDRRLAERFPEVGTDERTTACVEILQVLCDDDLLEHD